MMPTEIVMKRRVRRSMSVGSPRSGVRRSGDRVETPRVKGMAAGETAQPEGRADDCTVAPDGLASKGRARRLEAAMRPEDR